MYHKTFQPHKSAVKAITKEYFWNRFVLEEKWEASDFLIDNIFYIEI